MEIDSRTSWRWAFLMVLLMIAQQIGRDDVGPARLFVAVVVFWLLAELVGLLRRRKMFK